MASSPSTLSRRSTSNSLKSKDNRDNHILLPLPVTGTRPAHLSYRYPSENPTATRRRTTSGSGSGFGFGSDLMDGKKSVGLSLGTMENLPISPSGTDKPSGTTTTTKTMKGDETVDESGMMVNQKDGNVGNQRVVKTSDLSSSTDYNIDKDNNNNNDDDYQSLSSPTSISSSGYLSAHPNFSRGQLFITSLSAFAFYFHPSNGVLRDRSSLFITRKKNDLGLDEEDGGEGGDGDGGIYGLDDADSIGEEVYHLIIDVRFVIGGDEWESYEESVKEAAAAGAGGGGGWNDGVRETDKAKKGGGTVISYTSSPRNQEKRVISPGRGLAMSDNEDDEAGAAMAGSGSGLGLGLALSPLRMTKGLAMELPVPILHQQPPSPSDPSRGDLSSNSNSTVPPPKPTTPLKTPRTPISISPIPIPNPPHTSSASNPYFPPIDDHDPDSLPSHPDGPRGMMKLPILLPNVYKITLFGAEHVEESLTRAEAIGEIIGSCGMTNHSNLNQTTGVGMNGNAKGSSLPTRFPGDSRRESYASLYGLNQAGEGEEKERDGEGSSHSHHPSAFPSASLSPARGFSVWGNGSRIESRSGNSNGVDHGEGDGQRYPLGSASLDGLIHERKTGLLDVGWREVAMYSEEQRGPMEVEWLTSIDVPLSTLTFGTHLVHPAIIAAGNKWGTMGNLRKMAVRGGFAIPMKVAKEDGQEDSWEASKPDYSFALKDWIGGHGLEILIWSFLGSYTEGTTLGILKRVFDFLRTGFEKGHRPTQTLILEDVVPAARDKLLARDKMAMFRVGLNNVSKLFLDWLEDIILIEVRDDESGHVDMVRLWDTDLSLEEGGDNLRVLRRFKSDMLANDHRTKRHPGLKPRADGQMSVQEQCELRFDAEHQMQSPVIDPGTPSMTPALETTRLLPHPSRTASCTFTGSDSTASLLTCSGADESAIPSPTIAMGQLSHKIGDDSRGEMEERPLMLEMRKGSQKSVLGLVHTPTPNGMYRD